MAQRGRPLPLAVKQEIRQRHAASEPLRKIAEALGISKTTAHKFGTKPLKERR
jgi:hypothetical protein